MTPLGTFSVVVSRSEVEAFRAATGLAPGGTVPLTFPMRWLAADDVRAALMALVAETDVVPVHESQTFDYVQPLVVEQRYAMRVEAMRTAGPERLTVRATLADEAARPVAALETILRLISTRAEAA